MTNIDDDESQWKMCFSATDVDLPTGYYVLWGELKKNVAPHVCPEVVASFSLWLGQWLLLQWKLSFKL